MLLTFADLSSSLRHLSMRHFGLQGICVCFQIFSVLFLVNTLRLVKPEKGLFCKLLMYDIIISIHVILSSYYRDMAFLSGIGGLYQGFYQGVMAKPKQNWSTRVFLLLNCVILAPGRTFCFEPKGIFWQKCWEKIMVFI